MPTRENKDSICVADKIKEELLYYKESSETWDDFMEKVIKLIEHDIQSESSA